MTISIQGHDWEVKTTPEAIGGDGGSRAFLGKGEQDRNLIFVDGQMPKSRQEEVFLHEIIHQVAPSMSEFGVQDMGKGLYAAFKENGLIPDDFLSRFVDGEATPEEMRRLNEENQDLLEDPFPLFMRVSDKGWEGTPLDDNQQLTVREEDGKVNRMAVHLAAAELTSNRLKIPFSRQRILAREVKVLYSDILREPVPTRINELSR